MKTSLISYPWQRVPIQSGNGSPKAKRPPRRKRWVKVYLKKCEVCGRMLDASHFYKSTYTLNGLAWGCRQCRSKIANAKKQQKRETVQQM